MDNNESYEKYAKKQRKRFISRIINYAFVYSVAVIGFTMIFGGIWDMIAGMFLMTLPAFYHSNVKLKHGADYKRILNLEIIEHIHWGLIGVVLIIQGNNPWVVTLGILDLIMVAIGALVIVLFNKVEGSDDPKEQALREGLINTWESMGEPVKWVSANK